MYNGKQQEHVELIGYKHMAIWLLAYKLYRDYFEVIMHMQYPEPEKFFEEWRDHFACSVTQEEKNTIWTLFVKLLIARSVMNK
jgi:hypothetical protein